MVTTVDERDAIESSTDGPGTRVRFASLAGIAADANGVLYVTDRRIHAIRRISAAGVVRTLADQIGPVGSGGGAHFGRPEPDWRHTSTCGARGRRSGTGPAHAPGRRDGGGQKNQFEVLANSFHSNSAEKGERRTRKVEAVPGPVKT